MTSPAINPRWPMWILGAGTLILFVSIPYASFTSDVANYALMGNDILKHGYLPTLAYGQSYLFSLTPYSYALTRLILPDFISDIVALKIAGALFSIPGILLMGESLLVIQRAAGKPELGSMALFALMIAASDSYLTDAQINSSNEISIFLTGALMYLTARLETVLAKNEPPPRRLWFLFGMVMIFMQYSRPMLLAFAIPAAAFLGYGILRDKGLKAAARPAGWIAAGIAIGYLPMLGHIMFRAGSWPYKWFLSLDIGGDISTTISILVYVILPRLMTMLWDEYPGRYIITALWLAAVALIVILAAAREGKKAFMITDRVWIIGQTASILVMAIIPSLAKDAGSRRYCLHLLPAVAWLFCRYAFPMGRASMAAIGLAGLLAVSSYSGWMDRLAWERERNGQVNETLEKTLPELERMNAVFIADYEIAYMLSFIGSESVIIEAFPWQIVRRYGYFTEEMTRQRTVWIVCEGYAHNVQNWFIDALGQEAVDTLKKRDLENRVMNRLCEAWELADPNAPAAVIKKHHPEFFNTPYPPW